MCLVCFWVLKLGFLGLVLFVFLFIVVLCFVLCVSELLREVWLVFVLGLLICFDLLSICCGCGMCFLICVGGMVV